MKPDARTVTVAPLDRRAVVTPSDPESRSVNLVFSTGADVLRYDWGTGEKYLERLSLDPKAIRLDRLNNGAPLLNAHSAYSVTDQIGIVQAGSATLDKAEARATVRFSKRADVEPIYQDVRDGIIQNVSVGYRVYRFDEQAATDKNAMPVRLATDWEPYEISMVPMGADAGARVRQSAEVETNTCVVVRAQEAQMAEEKKPVETKPADAPATPSQPDEAAIRATERDRITGIQNAVRLAGLEPTVAADMVTRDLTLDAARAEIFTHLAAKDAKRETRSQGGIEVGADARDRFLRGALNWLLVKGGGASLVARADKVQESTIDPGEFRGMTLLDLAKECLTRSGVSTRGLSKMQLAGEAFSRREISQSTSDFAVLLENVMHKMLQAAYATVPDTWSTWCARGTVTDFRAHNRYRMGSFGALDTVSENGEFKNKAISDAEKATITAATKGNIINVSRQMIVNDDMGAFTRLLSMLGRAAALSVEVDAYALLGQNSGLGPTQTDTHPLFYDATRGNVSSTLALSAAAIDLDRVKMAGQKDPWGNEYLDLRPMVLLVATALGGQARVINLSQYDPDNISGASSKAVMKPNVVAGLFSQVVDTPRLSGTRRYIFADPGVAPVFEVAFLEGQSAPVLETQNGWRTDGAEMKVRFDYGVAAVDYRGAVTNAG